MKSPLKLLRLNFYPFVVGEMGKVAVTFLTLVSGVSRHALTAEGAPFSVTAPPVAAGRKSHVDAAAICGQAARRAGLRVGRRAQIIQLEGGDTGEDL